MPALFLYLLCMLGVDTIVTQFLTWCATCFGSWLAGCVLGTCFLLLVALSVCLLASYLLNRDQYHSSDWHVDFAVRIVVCLVVCLLIGCLELKIYYSASSVLPGWGFKAFTTLVIPLIFCFSTVLAARILEWVIVHRQGLSGLLGFLLASDDGYD